MRIDAISCTSTARLTACVCDNWQVFKYCILYGVTVHEIRLNYAIKKIKENLRSIYIQIVYLCALRVLRFTRHVQWTVRRVWMCYDSVRLSTTKLYSGFIKNLYSHNNEAYIMTWVFKKLLTIDPFFSFIILLLFSCQIVHFNGS